MESCGKSKFLTLEKIFQPNFIRN